MEGLIALYLCVLGAVRMLRTRGLMELRELLYFFCASDLS